jgi:hypothetical protein
MEESEIAAFQASLLEILSTQSDPTQTGQMLEDLSTTDAMTAYIATFDPRMVQVAADLVKQWGRCYSDRREEYLQQ